MKIVKYLVGPIVALYCGVTQAIPMELSDSGVVWTWSSSDIGQNTGQLMLSADVSGSTLSANPAYLLAFSLKLDGIGVDSASISDPYGDWQYSSDELSGNGSGCTQGSNAIKMCFEDIQPLDVTDVSNFAFDIAFDLADSEVLPDLLHLKVNWVTTAQEICTQNANQGTPQD